jgi:hypothetical protein
MPGDQAPERRKGHRDDDAGGVHGRGGVAPPGLDDHRHRRRGRPPSLHGGQVAQGRWAAGPPAGRRHRDRPALDQADRGAAGPQPEPAGHLGVPAAAGRGLGASYPTWCATCAACAARAGAGPARSRCRSRPSRARRRRPTGQTVATGVRGLAWGRCTASGRSCAGRGTASGGLPHRWTAPTRWRAWWACSRTPAAYQGGSGSTTWVRWSRAPIRGWCCTRRRGSSPPPTGSRSRAAGR